MFLWQSYRFALALTAFHKTDHLHKSRLFGFFFFKRVCLCVFSFRNQNVCEKLFEAGPAPLSLKFEFQECVNIVTCQTDYF